MKALLIAFVLSLSPVVSGQGNIDGFFKSKGELDVALSGTYVYSRVYFAGVSPILYERDQQIIGAYGVYGLSDRWNVGASLPVINFTPQDLSLFGKYKLYDSTFRQGQVTFAPALELSFPITNYNTESGQAIGQKAVRVSPKMVLQFKHQKNWFVQAQSGFNYSFKPVPSSISTSAKVGYIFRNWYFDFWYDFQYAIGGKDYATGGSEPLNSFRELGVSYERVGGVIYASVSPNLGFFVGVSTVLSGRNTSDSNTFNAGLVIKFKTNQERIKN